jgi:hypothetical protein
MAGKPADCKDTRTPVAKPLPFGETPTTATPRGEKISSNVGGCFTMP